jgi:hypothetical protein
MRTKMPLSLTCFESQSSLKSSVSEMMDLPPSDFSDSMLAVNAAMTREAQDLQLQGKGILCTKKKQKSSVAKQKRVNFGKSFQKFEKLKSTGWRTQDKSLRTVNVPLCNCSSTLDFYVGNSNIQASPLSCRQIPYWTKYPEVPELQLHKNPVALVFPDRMSCVISERPDRTGTQMISEPRLSEPNSSSYFPMNVQRISGSSADKSA